MPFHAFLRDWLRPFIRALQDGLASRLFTITILFLCFVSLYILAILLLKTADNGFSRRDTEVGETRCRTRASSSSFRHEASSDASTAGVEQLPGSLSGARSPSQTWESPQSHPPPRLPLSPTSLPPPRAQPAERDIYRPINSLPPEVFRIILEYFAPRQGASESLEAFLFSPFPLRLVGKRWQTTIDQSAELWKSINMSLGKSNHDPRIFEWYQRVTQRVTSFDSIAVRFPEKARFINTYLSQHLFGLIAKTKAVTIDIPASLSRDCSASPTLPDSFSQIPMRENVRRQLSNGLDLEDLRRVKWHMSGSSFHSYFPEELSLPWSSFFALPWGTLSHVKLFVKMSLHNCLIIFQFASSIEKLSLRTVYPHEREVAYPERNAFSLLHLRSLTINAEVNLDRLFWSCHLPALRKLKLELEGDDAVSRLHELDIGWWDLTQVSLEIPLNALIVQGILERLEAVERLSIIVKGPHMDVGTWSLRKRLPSLRRFKLSPDNPATDIMMLYVSQHILTDSIENITSPLIHYRSPPYPNFLGSLRIIRLNKPISPRGFLSILSHATLIDKGQFEISDSPVEEDILPPASQLPSPVPHLPPPTIAPTLDENVTSKIRSLKLTLKLKRISGESLMRALTLPNLMKLEFKASRSSKVCSELYNLLERSRCPLVDLSADCHLTCPEAVLRVLVLLSRSLQRLEVMNSSVITSIDSQHCFGRQLFDQLVYDHDDNPGSTLSPLSSLPPSPTTATPRTSRPLICPNLEHLCIWPCVDLDSFRRMVSSRWTNAITTTTTNNHDSGCKKLAFVGAAFPPGDDLIEFEKELKEHRVSAKLERLAERSVVYPPCDLY